MKEQSEVISVRVPAWLAKDMRDSAKAQGIATSLLYKQYLLQGVSNQNTLADYITNEGEKTEKLLKRIESVVIGHLELVVAGMIPKNANGGVESSADDARNVFKTFREKLIRGRKVSMQLDEIIASRAKEE